jgi:intein-encoded DNA endonuclease-like protein
MPIQKKVNKNFFKKWTREMAYVLGFFAADGYVTVNKRGGQFWCIQITDKKLLQSIKKAIQSEHKISTKLPSKNKPNESILYRLQVGSIEMCDDLRSLGFSEKKTKNLVIPNMPQKYFRDFVRGYFDGDGNVWMGDMHKKRKTKTKVIFVAFTSCTVEFLKELHSKLNLLGFKGGCIYRSKKGEFCRLQLSTLNALKLYNFMYNRNTKDFLGLYLYRKKKVFEKFMRLRL